MKNIMQPETKREVVARINRLKPDTPKEWGKMSVNQMLFHCNEGVKISYGDLKPTYEPTGKIMAAMMRFVILRTNVPGPKGKTETFPEINMVERGINPPDFEEVKNNLIEAVNKFPSKPTLPQHAFMGKFSDENWARLNYVHINHHLKQFGV